MDQKLTQYTMPHLPQNVHQNCCLIIQQHDRQQRRTTTMISIIYLYESNPSQLQHVHVVTQTLTLVHHVLSTSTTRLQLHQQQLLQITKHTLLLHTRHIPLSHPLPLIRQSSNLFLSLLSLSLNIFLTTLISTATLSISLNVLPLLSQSHHLQINQLIL